MRKSILVLLAVTLTMGGCSAKPRADWVMVGGSKADGAVVMGVDVPPMFGVYVGSIDHDINQANNEADRRCKNWGYSGAEMYREGQYPIQVLYYQLSVAGYRLRYQCTGGVDASHSPREDVSAALPKESSSMADEIKKLDELKKQGIITEKEYQKGKENCS